MPIDIIKEFTGLETTVNVARRMGYSHVDVTSWFGTKSAIKRIDRMLAMALLFIGDPDLIEHALMLAFDRKNEHAQNVIRMFISTQVGRAKMEKYCEGARKRYEQKPHFIAVEISVARGSKYCGECHKLGSNHDGEAYCTVLEKGLTGEQVERHSDCIASD